MHFCQMLRSLAISVSKKLNICRKKQMGSVYNDWLVVLHRSKSCESILLICRVRGWGNNINQPMPFWWWLVGRTACAMIKGTSTSQSCSDCPHVKVALNKALEPWLAPNGVGSTLHSNKSPLEIPVFTGHLKVQTSALWVQSNRTESWWWILQKKGRGMHHIAFKRTDKMALIALLWKQHVNNNSQEACQQCN